MLNTGHKKGSVMAITLIYISLLLVAIVALFFGISQLIRLQALGTSSLQAGYTAESGVELGLLAVKLREAGYEPQVNTVDISQDDSVEFDLDYRTKDPIVMSITDPDDVVSLALYYDDGKSIKDNNGDNTTIFTAQNDLGTNDCVKIRLLGKNDKGEYDSISTTSKCSVRDAKGRSCMDTNTYSCQDTLSGTAFRDLQDDSIRNSSTASTTTQTFQDFINTHTETKLEIKALDASLSDPVFIAVQSLGRTLASYQYTLTSKGVSSTSTIQKSTKGVQESPLSITTFTITNRQ